LNLAGVIDRVSLTYQLLNMIGAGLSAIASLLIGFIPFVVLEGLWAIIAGVAIAKRGLRSPPRINPRRGNGVLHEGGRDQ
jgi:hypothetical protein